MMKFSIFGVVSAGFVCAKIILTRHCLWTAVLRQFRAFLSGPPDAELDGQNYRDGR